MHTVNQVAKKIGVSAETIRYYTREGIIKPRRDESNGYRYYSDHDVNVIHFIRKAKSYGLTIHEIREILNRSSRGESPCPLVKELVTLRFQETRKKIAELQSLETKLASALLDWESTEDPIFPDHLICPLIETD